MTFFRAVSSTVLQLGNKPAVVIDVNYSGLIPDDKRYHNLLRFLEHQEPEKIHRTQKVKYEH